MKYELCVEEYRNLINAQLENYANSISGANEKLLSSVKYSLLSGGKRIRGILLLAFSELFGGNCKDVLPVACAVEMIHAYSLIHDDLPCMDNDDLRRGKPSNHKVYGDDIALLAGDALLTLGFEILSARELLEKFGGEKLIHVYKLLSSAAGVEGMVSGQADDLCMENGKYDVKQILNMYRKKTGVLIEASIEIGAVLSGVDGNSIRLAKLYGGNLGLIFQLVDDLLDIMGQEDVIGKPVGSDLDNKKCTYVYACGVESTRNKVRELTEESLNILDQIGGNNEFLKCLTKKLEVRVK